MHKRKFEEAARSVSIEQMEAFVQVVELGSFSAAAERRLVTQPAVSLQIRKLERRLGVGLIERSGRRAVPTAAGEELLPHARAVLAALDGALESVAPHGDPSGGRVRIGTGATACIHFLPGPLRELKRRFPAVQVSVATGNTADILRKVGENALDMAIVTLPASGRSLDIARLMEDEFVLIGPRSDALGETATAAAIARLPMVLYDRGSNTRKLIDDWFAAARVVPNVVMELESIEAIKEMVSAGLGYSIVPAMAVRGPRRGGPFKASSLRPPLARDLAIAMRKDKRMGGALRQTLRALQAAAKAREGGTPG